MLLILQTFLVFPNLYHWITIYSNSDQDKVTFQGEWICQYPALMKPYYFFFLYFFISRFPFTNPKYVHCSKLDTFNNVYYPVHDDSDALYSPVNVVKKNHVLDSEKKS